MINLLPPNDRRQLAAARTNTLLVRYVVVLPILIIAMIAEMGAVYFFMNSIQTNNQRVQKEPARRKINSRYTVSLHRSPDRYRAGAARRRVDRANRY